MPWNNLFGGNNIYCVNGNPVEYISAELGRTVMKDASQLLNILSEY